VRDADRLAPTFGDIEDELQRSAVDEIRLHRGGATRRRVTWCWLRPAGSPTERWRASMAARVSIYAYQNS
jgi:hypothetical protein